MCCSSINQDSRIREEEEEKEEEEEGEKEEEEEDLENVHIRCLILWSTLRYSEIII